MKKLIALLLAVSITCAVATGCSEDSSETAAKTSSSASSSLSDSSSQGSSESESSSQADSKNEEETTTTTTSTQEETTTTTSAQEQTTTTKETSSESGTTTTKQSGGAAIKFEDSYTYKFQQQAASKALAMNLSMKYAGIDMPIEFKKNGEDFYLKMSFSQGQNSMAQEYYYVGGTTYTLNSATKTYSEVKGSAANVGSVTNLVPTGTFEVLSSKEENGMIVEVVRVKNTSAAGKVTTVDATYYYDKASGEPRKIDVSSSAIKTTVNVTKFEIGAQTITLPDLTGWTKSNGTTTIM